MTDRIDQRLGEALETLPRVSASPSFTPRLLGRLEERGRRPARDLRWKMAAVAALLALLALAASLHRGVPEEPTLPRQAEAMRQEHQRLVRELETLRSLARESRPVVYLGGDGEVDYLLDLGSLADKAARAGIQVGDASPPSPASRWARPGTWAGRSVAGSPGRRWSWSSGATACRSSPPRLWGSAPEDRSSWITSSISPAPEPGAGGALGRAGGAPGVAATAPGGASRRGVSVD